MSRTSAVTRAIAAALATSVLAAPFAPFATAQQRPAASAPAAAERPWRVDWGHYYCSLIRKPEPGRRFSTVFVTIPGGAGTAIRLIPEARQQTPGNIDRVVLLPSGASGTVSSSDEYRGRVTHRIITGLSPDFRAQLAAASEMQLWSARQLRARVPLDGVRGALGALRQCSSEVSREWGVDEVRLAALRERPSSPNFLGYNSSDYPEAALRTATQGRVILRITVAADSTARDCAVVATSGSPEIDATSCRVAMRHGRYRAGIDAAGQPVTIASIFVVTWRLPSLN